MTYLFLGVFTGLLSGLLGIGGGILITPALVFIFHQQSLFPNHAAQIAAGSSLAVIIFTSLTAVITYQQKNSIDWAFVKGLLPGLILGGPLGALTATFISSQSLSRFLGGFIVLISLQMLFLENLKSKGTPPHKFLLLFLGGMIGFIGGLVGIGGGLLLAPFLTFYQLPIYRIAGTMITCSFFIATSAVLSLTLIPHFLPHVDTIYIFWPAVLWIVPTSIIFAWLGTLLAHKLPINIMKRIFSIFFALAGSYLIFRH